MKIKFYILGCSFLTTSFMFSQVGIGTNSPIVTLQVNPISVENDTAEGFMAPSLTREQLIKKDDMYNTNHKGSLVYVSDLSGTTTTKTAKILTVGYYSFNGDIWEAVGGSEPWFIQETTDESRENTDNIFQMGNVAIGANTSSSKKLYVAGDTKITGSSELGTGVLVTADGKVGIGTATPSAQLSLEGNSANSPIFHLKDNSLGPSPLGYYLTSDSQGNGTWKAPGTSFAIAGKLTVSPVGGQSYTSTLITNRTGYSGMYIDLPEGTFQINFTVWVTPNGTGAGTQRFCSVFFSKSSRNSGTVALTPNYALGIKSVVINPTYSGSANDFYGSGAIPIIVKSDEVATYGGPITSPIVGEDPVKKDGYVRYYLWIYTSSDVGGTQIVTRTLSPGQFGPYSQLYAIPFAFDTE